jgi:hypothetical protein
MLFELHEYRVRSTVTVFLRTAYSLTSVDTRPMQHIKQRCILRSRPISTMIPSFRSVQCQNAFRRTPKYATPFTRSFTFSASRSYRPHLDPESIEIINESNAHNYSSAEIVNQPSEKQDPPTVAAPNQPWNEHWKEEWNPQYSSSPKNSGIDALFSKPSWSVRSLIPDPDTPLSNEVTPQKLHHLLRLSALPQPESDVEEKEMLNALHSHLHFVREIQSVNTEGVEPLQSIRDETIQGIKEATIGLDQLKWQLGLEEVKGRGKRPRRPRVKPPIKKAEDWDVLGTAQDKVHTPTGSYFVVRSGTEGVPLSRALYKTFKSMGQSINKDAKIIDMPDTPLYKVYTALSQMVPKLAEPEEMTVKDLFSALEQWEALSNVTKSEDVPDALHTALEESLSEVWEGGEKSDKPLYENSDEIVFSKR